MFDLSTTSLLLGLLFGSVGMGYCMYGRRQRAVVPMLCGVLLILFPYFVYSTTMILLVGTLLMAVPWFWKD